VTTINWIQIETAGALGIMPRPRGGDWLIDEVRAWKTAGVDRVVSALEPLEESFLDLEPEEAMCREHGIAFDRFQVMDRSAPRRDEGSFRFVQGLAAHVAEGQKVVVHCRLGIGRSAMICAATLVALGLDSQEAFLRVEAARGLQVPDTADQIEWVKALERWHRDAWIG